MKMYYAYYFENKLKKKGMPETDVYVCTGTGNAVEIFNYETRPERVNELVMGNIKVHGIEPLLLAHSTDGTVMLRLCDRFERDLRKQKKTLAPIPKGYGFGW